MQLYDNVYRKFKPDKINVGKESYDQLRQHIEKQRHYFVNKGLSSQGLFFSVVMYGSVSWTIKKAEH